MKVHQRQRSSTRSLLLLSATILLHLKTGGAAAPHPDCPEVHVNRQSYVLHNKCYEFVISAPSTWLKAQEFCEERGGQLVQIKSDLVQSFLAQKIEALGKAYQETNYWIGANDRKSEGVWQWTDGTRLSYTKWFTKLPRIACGGSNGRQCPEHADCAVMKPRQQYRWFDSQCRTPAQAFVCEYYYVSSAAMTTTTERQKRADAAGSQSSSNSKQALPSTSAVPPATHHSLNAAAGARNGSRPLWLPLRNVLLSDLTLGGVRTAASPTGNGGWIRATYAEVFRAVNSSLAPHVTAVANSTSFGGRGAELGPQVVAFGGATTASRPSAAVSIATIRPTAIATSADSLHRASTLPTRGESAVADATSTALDADDRQWGGSETRRFDSSPSARDVSAAAADSGLSNAPTTAPSHQPTTADVARNTSTIAGGTGRYPPVSGAEADQSTATPSDTVASIDFKDGGGNLGLMDAAIPWQEAEVGADVELSDVAEDAAAAPPLQEIKAGTAKSATLAAIVVGAACLVGGVLAAGVLLTRRRLTSNHSRSMDKAKTPLKVSSLSSPRDIAPVKSSSSSTAPPAGETKREAATDASTTEAAPTPAAEQAVAP